MGTGFVVSVVGGASLVGYCGTSLVQLFRDPYRTSHGEPGACGVCTVWWGLLRRWELIPALVIRSPGDYRFVGRMLKCLCSMSSACDRMHIVR